MTTPAGYFVAPDAYGDIHIWRENGDYPTPALAARDLQGHPELWDYLTCELPHRFGGGGMTEPNCPKCGQRCDICDERMCAEYGPEPAPTCGAHQECVDCVADSPCRGCAAARREGAA